MIILQEHLNNEHGYPLTIEYHRLLPRSAKTRCHWHYNLEISCIFSGEGEYLVEDRLYEVNEGDIFLFNSEENHGLGVNSHGELHNIVIALDPRFIWSLESSLFDIRYLKMFYERSPGVGNRLEHHSPSAVIIGALFRDIIQEMRMKPPEYALMIKTKLLTILVELLRHLGPMLQNREEEQSRKQGLGLINAVIQYMDKHLDQEIRMDNFARLCHMNTSYFSTFFKKYMGLAPKEFMMRRRIQRAVEYLRTSDKTVLDIAGLCGFNNTSAFNKAFKNITGKTPSEFRSM